VRASPLAALLAEQTGAAVDGMGRLEVEPDLSLPGRPEVFAIGDLIAIPGVPGMAQPAIQEGKYVARVVAARLTQKAPPPPFRYRDKGIMATIGRTRAVAQIGRLEFAGLPAFLLWALVHLFYLVGWGSRIEAVVRWLWTIVARNRRERLISLSGVVQDEPTLETRG
jgi:NADH dehydrogenase